MTYTTAAARRVIRRVLTTVNRHKPDAEFASLNLLTLGMAPGEFLLAALARERGGVARRLLADADVDPNALAAELRTAVVEWPSENHLPHHAVALGQLMIRGVMKAGEFSTGPAITTAQLLHALLEAGSPVLREALAASGAAFGSADPIAALRRHSVDIDALRWACETADTADEGPGEPLDPPESIDTLMDALTGETSDARTVALQRVLLRVVNRRHGASRLVPAITRLLNDRDPANRALAAQALGEIGPAARSAADALRERFQDHPSVRVAAAAALHALGLAGTVPEPDVRAALDRLDTPDAAWVLWQYTADADSVVPRLRAMLTSDQVDTRLGAAMYLRAIGPPAEAALVDLESLADNDPNEHVRQVARQSADVVSGAAPPQDDCVPDDVETDDDETDVGESERAFVDWADALERDPYDPDALLGRAALHQQNGDLKAAIADWSAVVTIDPTDVETLRQLAWARVQLGEYAAADADLTTALGVAPDDSDLLYKRGISRRRSGDVTGAMVDFDTLLQHDPDRSRVWHARSKARLLAGDYAGVVADVEQAMQLDPDDGAYLNDLAWYLSTLPDPAIRNPSRAIRLAESAVALHGGVEPSSLDTLACAYASAGQFDRAVEVIGRALALADDAEQQVFAEHLQLFRRGQPYLLPIGTTD